MTDEQTIEELAQALERAGKFRIEWNGEWYTIWSGYNDRHGWHGKESARTLREVLQHGLTPP